MPHAFHREEGHGHSQGSHQDAIYPSPPECAVNWYSDSQNSSSPRRKRGRKKRRQKGKSDQKETPMKQQSSQQEQQKQCSLCPSKVDKILAIMQEEREEHRRILEVQKKQNNDLRQQNNDLQNNDLQNNDLREQNNDLGEQNNDLRHRVDQLLSKLEESNALMRTEQESQRRQDAKQEHVALRFVNEPKTRICQKEMITGENGDPLHIEIRKDGEIIREGALASVDVKILAWSKTYETICESILQGNLSVTLDKGRGSLNISFKQFLMKEFGKVFVLKARVAEGGHIAGNYEVREAVTRSFDVLSSRMRNYNSSRNVPAMESNPSTPRRATNTRNVANRQSPPMSVHYRNENCNNTAAVVVGPRASPTLSPNASACQGQHTGAIGTGEELLQPSSAPDVSAARNCFGGNNGGVSGESGMPNMQMLSHHTTYDNGGEEMQRDNVMEHEPPTAIPTSGVSQPNRSDQFTAWHGNCSGQATGEIGGQHIISSTPAVEHHPDQPSNVPGTGLGDDNSRAIITSSGWTYSMNDASGYGGPVYSQPTNNLPEFGDLQDFDSEEAFCIYLA